MQVKCDPRGVSDLYGSYYSFTANVCKPGSVTVMITDNCPKNENQRWCSGDMPHLDLSIEAFSSVSILVSPAPPSRPPCAVPQCIPSILLQLWRHGPSVHIHPLPHHQPHVRARAWDLK